MSIVIGVQHSPGDISAAPPSSQTDDSVVCGESLYFPVCIILRLPPVHGYLAELIYVTGSEKTSNFEKNFKNKLLLPAYRVAQELQFAAFYLSLK